MIYALLNDLHISRVSSSPPHMFMPCFIFNPLQIPLPPYRAFPTDPTTRAVWDWLDFVHTPKKGKRNPS